MTEPEYYTTEEVATRLRISKPHVTDMCRRGQLPAYKLGPRNWRIPRVELADWLNKHRNNYGGFKNE